MRERTRLADGVEAIDSFERELSDAVELLALGEVEGDAEIVAESEEALRALKIHGFFWAISLVTYHCAAWPPSSTCVPVGGIPHSRARDGTRCSILPPTMVINTLI